MATETAGAVTGTGGPRAWLSGVLGGVLASIVTGIVVQIGFDATILSDAIPSVVGLSGLVAGWVVFLVVGAVAGLVYAGLASLELIARYAIVPGTGAPLGLVYGLVLWAVAVAAVALGFGAAGADAGSYALNAQAGLSYALFGLIIGLVYGMSPYTGY